MRGLAALSLISLLLLAQRAQAQIRLCEVAFAHLKYSVETVLGHPNWRYTGYNAGYIGDTMSKEIFEKSLKEGVVSPFVRNYAKQNGISIDEAVKKFAYIKTAPQEFVDYWAFLNQQLDTNGTPFVSTSANKTVAGSYGPHPWRLATREETGLKYGAAESVSNLPAESNAAIYTTDISHSVRSRLNYFKYARMRRLLNSKAWQEAIDHGSIEGYKGPDTKLAKKLWTWLAEHRWLGDFSKDPQKFSSPSGFQAIFQYKLAESPGLFTNLDYSWEAETAVLLNIPPEDIVKAEYFFDGSADMKYKRKK